MAKYTGKYPYKINSVFSTGKRGEVTVKTNDGLLYVITAKQTGGFMPKVGEDVTQYLNPASEKFKEYSERMRNPRDIHIDIGAHNVKRNPRVKHTVKNYGDSVRDKMLIKMINGAIEDALKRKNAKDYSRVNGYLGYAQGVIATALKVKAITASEANQFKAQIKQIVM